MPQTEPVTKKSPPPDLMTTSEVADLIDVDRRTVVNWIKSGLLPLAFRTLGGHYRIRREDALNAIAVKNEVD